MNPCSKGPSLIKSHFAYSGDAPWATASLSTQKNGCDSVGLSLVDNQSCSNTSANVKDLRIINSSIKQQNDSPCFLLIELTQRKLRLKNLLSAQMHVLP